MLQPCSVHAASQSSSVRLPRSRSVLRRGAAPCSRPAQLRVAPRWLRLSLRDRSVVAPWSLRPCSMRASLAAPPSAQPACTPCPCRRMPPHARGTPSHGNGPGPSRPARSGHCRADTANCPVAAVCTGSTASSVLSMCTQEYLQTVFAMLKHFLKS